MAVSAPHFPSKCTVVSENRKAMATWYWQNKKALDFLF